MRAGRPGTLPQARLAAEILSSLMDRQAVTASSATSRAHFQQIATGLRSAAQPSATLQSITAALESAWVALGVDRQALQGLWQRGFDAKAFEAAAQAFKSAPVLAQREILPARAPASSARASAASALATFRALAPGAERRRFAEENGEALRAGMDAEVRAEAASKVAAMPAPELRTRTQHFVAMQALPEENRRVYFQRYLATDRR